MVEAAEGRHNNLLFRLGRALLRLAKKGCVMSQSAPPPIPETVAEELVRQGEVRLSAILNMGIAADARATSLCSIFGAGGVAIGAGLLANVTSDHPINVLIVPGIIASGGLLIAAVISALVASPQYFLIPGGDPAHLRDWSWDKNKWRSQTELLDATAMRYARAIKKDMASLERGAKLLHWALGVAGGSILVAVTVFLSLKGP
jgi:hypothetical protein